MKTKELSTPSEAGRASAMPERAWRCARLAPLLSLSLWNTSGSSQVFAQASCLHSGTPNAAWAVIPEEEVGKDIGPLVRNGYRHPEAVEAIVPGTVFASFVAAGLEKDPNFGDNIQEVDRKKYDRSFWYRTEFKVPADFDKEIIWLNFDGINRKGRIYLNGNHLGDLDGFMHRGHFDVTRLADRGGLNTLAVLVDIPRAPLANYGSPNYLSSGGWDWMPCVPGLNSGITDKVWLENTGKFTITDPWMRSKLVSRSLAELTLQAEVTNNGDTQGKATVKGTITPGDITFSQEVDLQAGETKTVKFDKRYFPQMVVNNPRLWWPGGYGEPRLYTCRLEVEDEGETSETEEFRFGIRQYSYDKKNGIFHLYVNGIPVFVKGSDWGMSEYMLRSSPEHIRTWVRLNKEMNFNMIRNWLGSVTEEQFYESCDELGIMVWDDFWINSNPDLPHDLNVFNNNMMEKIRRFRNHACVAVWCGDNEGTPEPPLAGWMAENIRTFDGGDRHFQPCSNNGGLSGSGPWDAKDPRWYFTAYPDCKSGSGFKRGWGFRTEIGTAAVPNYESLVKFMPDGCLWPVNEMWNLHYFGPSAFNAGPERHAAVIEERYGGAKDAREFCTKSQWVSYESNKALFEGWLDHMWDDATGVMLWMSGASYPGMVWQTYDYYYDLTGAYFGCKQACEPVHIYWNPVTEEVKVANTTAKDYDGLTAEAVVYNMDGKPVARYGEKAAVNSASNAVAQCFRLKFDTGRDILSLGCPAYASSTNQGEPAFVTDGKDDTRWAAVRADNEWICVDLGSEKPVGGVRLNWEAAYGKSYKIQVSDDARNWTEVYKTEEGREGINEVLFPEEIKARYVRMLGMELGWWFGYSLWSMDVLGGTKPSEGLSDVHFLRLTLKDKDGKVISENNYWRGNERTNFKALDQLPGVRLNVSSRLARKDGKATIQATIGLPGSAGAVAFGVRVQAVRASDGERLLPALMNDNYFTLMPGEKKDIRITFNESLLQGGSYKLIVEPYNKRT